jgi:hypothetical protein
MWQVTIDDFFFFFLRKLQLMIEYIFMKFLFSMLLKKGLSKKNIFSVLKKKASTKVKIKRFDREIIFGCLDNISHFFIGDIFQEF